MTEPDPIDQALERARSGLTPSSAAQRQVLTRLEAQFPGLAQSGPVPIAPVEHAQRVQVDVAAQVSAAGFWSTVKATGGGGVTLGAVLLAVGFAAGYSLSIISSEAPPHIDEAPSLGTVPRVTAPVRDMGTPGEPAAAAGTPHVNDVPTGHEGSTPPPANEPPRRARVPLPSTTPTNELERELLLLQRAERALRANHPDLTLALLDELDQQHPDTLLAEERAATRVMAACQAGKPGSLDVARDFLSTHPSSVYADRVRALCPSGAVGAETSVPVTEGLPPDTDGR